jgi:cob(I)alamin adenosyltransferase
MTTSFYTRGGDEGYTGLLGEGRAAKEDIRLEALGAVDEANAALGMARALARSPESPGLLLQVQRDLYGLMAELAATGENAARFRTIHAGKVTWLEAQIDAFAGIVQMPGEFIVPGDAVESAFFDLARAIVRRAERRVAALLHRGDIANPELLRYLNRLSSLCFVLELRENQITGNSKLTLAKSGDDHDRDDH